MASIPTLGSMMMQLAYPTIKPYDHAKAMIDAAQAASGMANARTALLQLEELKRQQQAQAEARQFMQAHPGAFLNTPGMEQSTLASLSQPSGALTQAPMPGMPGQAQTVPAYPDASRYAGVSPQGGGPIPSDLAAQVTPTMMPGQPTRAQLSPQRQSHPLEALMRQNPAAAMQVMQMQQQVQDARTRAQETQLTIRTRVAEYIARGAQAVNSQDSLDVLRQDLQQVAPQAAAQLPQFYSKEAMQPFIKQGLSVKDSAQLQLETWKTQLEMGRLGLQGEPAAMVSELRAMGVNPLQATPEQRQQAQKNIQARELEQKEAEQRLRFQQEQQLQSTLPLQDARKEDAGLFVYKGTGNTVEGTRAYQDVKTLQDEKDPTKGVVKLANLEEKKQLTTLKQLEPVLQQYADLVQYAYGTDAKTGKKGPLADYQRGPFQTIGAMWNQLSQDDPVFQAKRRALQGQLQSVVRGLGARGDLNAQELEAATQMLANMDASLGLGLSLGPMVGTGGVGVGGSIKPSISLPDTPETGINIANELIGTVNRRIGSLLQHEGYNKTPYIRIRTDQEQEAKPGEMPRATAPPQPAPAPVPEAGPPIFPRPQITIPGEGTPPPRPPAPTTRPTPPTATSTPAQDEAYRQSVGQGTAPAPAPRSPAARPTPGRQSQAPPQTRVAGANSLKVMNLADVAEAMRQTGRSRRDVEQAARDRGYTVYGSKLPLPTALA